jgi:pyrimidine operon attenuation protein/uracil phosphoribosyltransferase
MNYKQHEPHNDKLNIHRLILEGQVILKLDCMLGGKTIRTSLREDL